MPWRRLQLQSLQPQPLHATLSLSGCDLEEGVYHLTQRGAPQDGSKETQLVKMLTVIKDRVVAEIRTRDKPHVRMLAALLRMDVTTEREAFLRGAVQNPEAAARFEEFVLDGIQYMEQVRGIVREMKREGERGGC